MEMTPLPSFWLKVRKEYIFDNINEMIEYLRLCPYYPNRQNLDFDNTLDCLNEVIDDWRKRLEDTPVFNRPDMDGRPKDVFVKLMGASILASHKKGITSCETISLLIKTLLSLDATIDASTWENLWKLAVACALGCKATKYTLKWDDLLQDELSLPLFAFQLARTEYQITGEAGMIENNGVVSISEDSVVRVAPVNAATYAKSRLKRMFEIDSMLIVEGKDEIKKNDFGVLETRGKQILHSMDSIAPSPKVKLKDYGHEETIPIRIIKRTGISNIAETIDPRYNRLSGKVKLDRIQHRPDNKAILSTLKEGDCVLCRLSSDSDFMFDLTDELEETYINLGESYSGGVDFAIFTGVSIDAHKLAFTTAHGLRVMLHKNTLNELDEDEQTEFLGRAESHLPVVVRFYDRIHSEDNNIKLYVQPEINWSETYEGSFSSEIADAAFVRIMKEDAEDFISELPAQEKIFAPLPEFSVNLLAHMLYNSAEDASDTPISRLKDLLAAAMLAKIGGRDCDAAYLLFRISELGRIVAFCSNEEVRDLRVDKCLEGCIQVEEAIELVDTLKQYTVDRPAAIQTSMVSDSAERNKRVRKLVESSNSLCHILDAKELDNIKYAIAKTLGAEEEFVHLADNSRTFYGVESISLEFKKSIVFPPKNRRRLSTDVADPELQRWAILKTICGFLNSRSGGELILGVNDDGYADGVEDDIQLLFKRSLIKKDDIDHYRQYVQRQVDYAFREYGAPTLSVDITSLNISFEAEINPEGKKILRIKVKPYPYGAVAFASELSRPEGYKESYVRKDGMTRELTPTLRDEVVKYKLDAASSHSRSVVLLSNAAENKTVARLRGYTSKSGTADREIEVYKVWKKRGLVLGYDLERKTIRVFKICRADSVELTDRRWTTSRGPRDRSIDPFGMLLDEGSAQVVELVLTDYGRLLLTEEIPSASLDEIRNTDSDKRWRFVCRVSSLGGIGRFCLGLPGEVEVVRGEALKTYLRDKSKAFS